MTKPSPYSSYLLRIWHSADGDPQSWRVSLQDLATGERLGFANLEGLFAFFETADTRVATQTYGGERKEATEQADSNTEIVEKPKE